MFTLHQQPFTQKKPKLTLNKKPRDMMGRTICQTTFSMKRITIIFSILFSIQIMAQSTASDIQITELPSGVQSVLQEYVTLLNSSANLTDAANAFTKIAGGGLINESATQVTLRRTTIEFSLKKDFNNIKFYTNPIQITRINYPEDEVTAGYGESAIKGRVYKIWIGKINPNQGMPAPVSIMVPEGHPTITTPKIINIGSL
jgi:hypothetical protein